jgi:hypothetical protein
MLWSRSILVTGLVVVCCWRKREEVAAEKKFRKISSESERRASSPTSTPFIGQYDSTWLHRFDCPAPICSSSLFWLILVFLACRFIRLPDATEA